jgi:hypothetical protein
MSVKTYRKIVQNRDFPLTSPGKLAISARSRISFQIHQTIFQLEIRRDHLYVECFDRSSTVDDLSLTVNLHKTTK